MSGGRSAMLRCHCTHVHTLTLSGVHLSDYGSRWRSAAAGRRQGRIHRRSPAGPRCPMGKPSQDGQRSWPSCTCSSCARHTKSRYRSWHPPHVEGGPDGCRRQRDLCRGQSAADVVSGAGPGVDGYRPQGGRRAHRAGPRPHLKVRSVDTDWLLWVGAGRKFRPRQQQFVELTCRPFGRYSVPTWGTAP